MEHESGCPHPTRLFDDFKIAGAGLTSVPLTDPCPNESLRGSCCQHTRETFSISLVMVLLTITAAAEAALSDYCERQKDVDEGYSDEAKERREKLSTAEIGSAIEHHELVEVSRFLVQAAQGDTELTQKWRLDTLLKGANVYQAPPPPKPEPVSPRIPS